MLTPNQLAELPLELYALVTELNDRIIEDIARRMAKTGRLTGTAEYELSRLQQIAAFDRDVQSLISKFAQISKDEVNTMFAAAAEASVANDIRISGVKALEYGKNRYLQQLTAQIAGTTGGMYDNLTDTLAFLNRQTGQPMGFRQTLINQLDKMELSVASGLETYDTAIRRAVNELGKSGIIDKQLFYINEKGTKTYRNLNVVARQTLFGGLRLMTREQAKYNASILGTDVFQITWHAGHRPSHGWGGLRYSLSGSHGLPTREELFAAHGGGTLSDYGCRHDEVAVDPDAPEMYSPEELRELEAKELETQSWNGKELTRYEQEEAKRQYERDIRKIRRDQTVVKDIMDSASPEEREAFAREYYSLKNKNNAKMREYEAFCDKMGLPTEKERIYYDGKGRLGGKVPGRYLPSGGGGVKINSKANIFAGMTQDQIHKISNDRHLTRLEEWAKAKWGVGSVDLAGLDAKAVSGTFKQMDKMIDKYPQLKGTIKEISKDSSGIMATNFSGRLTFNPNYYDDVAKIERVYSDAEKMGMFPKNTTWENAGVHELGHRLNAEAIRTQYSVTSAMINDWNNDITADKIVKKAIKGLRRDYDLRGLTQDDILSDISAYAMQNTSEAIAEAFSDYWTNGSKASFVSLKIIEIVKGMLP